MKTVPRRGPLGFSLLEALTVLFIIGVVSAVLFPVLSSVRHRNNDAICTTNMQQIGHALTLYAADYDGSYPQAIDAVFVNGIVDNAGNCTTWRTRVATYLKQRAFPHCSERLLLPGLTSETHEGDFSGYTMNDNLNAHLNTFMSSGTQSIKYGIQEARLQYPSVAIIAAEARAGIISQKQSDMTRTATDLKRYAVYYDILAPLICTQAPGALRHHGGANCAFADGHVKWLLPSQLSVTPRSDGITPGFGL